MCLVALTVSGMGKFEMNLLKKFLIRGNSSCVTLVVGENNLEIIYSEKERRVICMKNILWIKLVSNGAESSVVRITHIVAKGNRKLSLKTISLISDPSTSGLVCEEIQRQIPQNRPKRVLVFINPNSGRKKAKYIFRKHVQPLMNQAGIETDVIVTKCPMEPKFVLQTYDINKIDGIITVGGDGLYSECINGLMLRTQTDAGVDYHNVAAKQIPTSIPVGLIPAGSGDVVVQMLHGTRDIKTAVIHVILGNSIAANVVSLHEGSQLRSYSGLILSFGLYGKIIKECEKFRWMGPSRYSVMSVVPVIRRSLMDIQLDYLPSDENPQIQINDFEQNETTCGHSSIDCTVGGINDNDVEKNILRKSHSTEEKETYRVDKPSSKPCQGCKRLFRMSDDFSEDGYRTITGSLYGVDNFVIPYKTNDGKSLPVFGDQFMSVHAVRPCKLLNHFTHLVQVKNHHHRCFDFHFIDSVETDRYKVEIHENENLADISSERAFYMNCDGELIKLQGSSFEVRLHRKVISLFGSDQYG